MVCIAAASLFCLALIGKKARLSVLMVALLLGATTMSLRQNALEQSQIRDYFQSSVEFSAQVVTDPTLTTSGNYTFSARLRKFTSDKSSFALRIPIRIISSKKIELLPGQSFEGLARVVETKESRVAALFIIDRKIVVTTNPSRWARCLGSIREGLRKYSGGGDAGSLIPGMVLGDTSKQRPEFKEAMKRSGLTHLVAVSGANFAIVSSFVLWGMQFFIRKIKYRVVVTAICLLCFIALVRPSPSVLRAAAMAAVLLSAYAAKRATDSLPALGLAMAVVVIGDPWQARDAGFALSVLATGGLLLLAPAITRRLGNNKKIAGIVAPPIAAMVFCSPVIVSLSGYVSPMSIVANIFAAPFVAPITIVGFIAALVSPVAPFVSIILIAIIRYPAQLIVSIAQWISNFPVLTIRSGSIGFVIVVVLIAVIWLFRKNWRQTTSVVLVVLLTLTWIQRWPVGDWQIANCDVGQGDAMVIKIETNRAIVIDVGPDSAAIDKCLNSLGIRDIPLLILSHFHADHVRGLAGAIHKRSVGQVWISSNAQPLVESAKSLAMLNKSQIVIAQKGMRAQVSQINLEVLWPEVVVRNFESLPGDGSAINNSSIAITISTPHWSLFTAGDLEPPAQREIVKMVKKVDIYKVSHHGSKYQDPELMQALSAQLAVISVGAKNQYRHPAPETIAALTRLGTQVVRTDLDGAVAIAATNHRLRIKKSKAWFRVFFWS